MDALILVLQIVILLGFVVGALLLKAYIPSYLRQKGENLASKEDIGEITGEIEKARAAYTSQLETLKAELKMTVEGQSRFREKSNESLVSFFDGCLELHGRLLPMNLDDFLAQDMSFVTKYELGMNDLFRRAHRDYYRVLLYCRDEHIGSSSGDLIRKVADAQVAFIGAFGTLRNKTRNRIRAENIADPGLEAQKQSMKESAAAMNTYAHTMSAAKKEIRGAFSVYLDQLSAYFDKLGQKAALRLAIPNTPEDDGAPGTPA